MGARRVQIPSEEVLGALGIVLKMFIIVSAMQGHALSGGCAQGKYPDPLNFIQLWPVWLRRRPLGRSSSNPGSFAV